MGTRIAGDKAEFLRFVNEEHVRGAAPLVDGYAPFCKHVFVPNRFASKGAALPITPENESLLRSEYEARTPKELPVIH